MSLRIPFRALLCSFILCAVALAQQPSLTRPQGKVRRAIVHNGWLKAQDYRGLDPDVQRLYVMGLLDGWYMAPMFGAPDNATWLMSFETCMEGMKSSQVAAILDKYITDHPEKWDADLKDVAFDGFREACIARGQWRR